MWHIVSNSKWFEIISQRLGYRVVWIGIQSNTIGDQRWSDYKRFELEYRKFLSFSRI